MSDHFRMRSSNTRASHYAAPFHQGVEMTLKQLHGKQEQSRGHSRGVLEADPLDVAGGAERTVLSGG